jgi:hypothetical protein
MTDPKELARGYREKSARCRRLARQTTDKTVAKNLLELAREFDEQAAELEKDAARNLP